MDRRQQERIESLKAGLIGAGAIAPVSLLLLTLGALWPALDVPIVSLTVPWPGLVHGAELGFTGFLFGVTYRYTVRRDIENRQLKAGTVMAFALVRALAQGDLGWHQGIAWPDLAVWMVEGLVLFAIAAFLLDLALNRGWLPPCDRPPAD